ncbi:amidase signature enzyme [Penicillium nucicola]|uniref:amidase signature enzyme n=1 Tax=Penicillium nucicola TaxID=1850975 RepID=UPI0025456221|nr:amidase signature enzyme [Penicillium nucicola]KAJ5775765.1 amidase signature enzyme [Penicillium nucicola]
MRVSTLVSSVLATCTFASNVIKVDDVQYYVPSKVELMYNFNAIEPFPITVVTLLDQCNISAWLNNTISDFLLRDDVYIREFSTAFYLQGIKSAYFDVNAESLLEAFGTNNIFWASPQNGSILPDGPYFATVSGLHQAWRLYDDHTNSFVLPTIPFVNDRDTYEVLPVKDTNPLGSMSIAVPSRLYYKPTPEQPLAGYRVAVKDQYAIKGLITTFGSRSYAKMYPPSNVTSQVIQNLIDLGAIIVGKTKLSLFASPLFTVAQWPDYSLPFNPRGDSHLIPGASSAGSGAAIAAYDWLDYSIGEDTGGSMRFPAAMNGVYGIRSTKNSTNNTATQFGPFDVAGHFARDVDAFNHLGGVMYSDPGIKNYTRFPKRILFPQEYWENINPDYATACNDYVKELEHFLGVKRTVIDTNSLWQRHSKQNISLAGYFANVIPYVSGTNDFMVNFRKDYFEQFESFPYVAVDKPSSSSLKPQNATLGQMGLSLQAEFQKFYRTSVLVPDKETCSEAIVVFPFNGNGGVPWYRDTNISYSQDGYAPALPGYISWNLLSVMNESPEVTVPVGAIRYQSKISLVEEEYPAALEIQGASGCDKMLLNLIREVTYAQGLPKAVKTGSKMY